jgi:hypothetical protein
VAAALRFGCILCSREVPVAAEPGGEKAAASWRGRLRASHADREHVIATLKAAFVQGRLTKDEFDARVGQTFASRTYAELDTLIADVPAALIGAQAAQQTRAIAQPSANKVTKPEVSVIIAAAILVAALFTGVGNTLERLALLAVLSPLWILALVGLLRFHSWLEKRSSRVHPCGNAAQRTGQSGGGRHDGSRI